MATPRTRKKVASTETKDVSKDMNEALSNKKAIVEVSKQMSRKRRHSEVEAEEKLSAIQLKEKMKKAAEECDDKIPEKYRKYRPNGYPLYLPVDVEQKNLRIYCDGIYDLFHLGHMNQLKQCKQMFPNVTLVVGVPSDKVTWKNKGLTVLTDTQRCETLKHCRWVDEVIPNAPWCVTPDFLKKHKIDYVAHDDIPYASADSDDVYAPVKRLGKFLVTQRTPGISTSDIITKIIRDYDKYLLRNFARGASRQELNVSWFKKNELDVKKRLGEFKEYWKKTNAQFNNVSKELYYEVLKSLRLSSTALRRINSTPNINTFAQQINDLANNDDIAFELLSPAADFAMKHTGNKNFNSRNILEDFKKWMFKNKDGNHSREELENSEDDDSNNSDSPVIRKKAKLDSK